MRFVVQQANRSMARRPGTLYLVSSNWDDGVQYKTLYNVYYINEAGKTISIGGTKIGKFGLQPGRANDPRDGYRYPHLPQEFETLGDQYFSLGQDPLFYEALTAIGDKFREEVLTALRDIAFNAALGISAEAEEVTRVSLLRDVPLPIARGQFARLARGGARLTPYQISLQASSDDSGTVEPITLDIAVVPDSRPPTNIQVLIGRNGVGKSTYLHNLATALVHGSDHDDAMTTVRDQLSNVVSVSFSAFDSFEPITVPYDRTKGLNYHYVGLKKIGVPKNELGKDHRALSHEMTRTARACLEGARRERWSRALKLLEVDPIFAQAGLSERIDSISVHADQVEVLRAMPEIFRGFSSGHKIVLLTVTRLVETVEEKSLVLLDEPEAHLHPPLLSAFIRALSDLLTHRNGIALIATHSPVVLQEVTRSCAWRLHRSGNEVAVDRLRMETFAENVGTLTDEVFGLEVTATGFHRILADAAADYGDYDTALASFGRQVGAEGRAILRAMINTAGAARVER
ncbi:AAA family ATPase [Nocardia sp. NPDC052001]|uniref:AAA family ATPase n=1 Tax=Nocardia sp. NPDC052001 TaxID=3154853 RepID=UPI00343FFFF3